MAGRNTTPRRKTTQTNKTPVTTESVTADIPQSSLSSMTVKLEAIAVPEQQIRRYFDPDKMAQLTASVKEHGILENLLVRPHPTREGFYQLVAGERRYRAAKEAKLTEVPVMVKDLTDEEALAISLVENLQRDDLNPVEETEGILLLLSTRLKLSVAEISSTLYRMHNLLTKKVTNNVIGKTENKMRLRYKRQLRVFLLSWG